MYTTRCIAILGVQLYNDWRGVRYKERLNITLLTLLLFFPPPLEEAIFFILPYVASWSSGGHYGGHLWDVAGLKEDIPMTIAQGLYKEHGLTLYRSGPNWGGGGFEVELRDPTRPLGLDQIIGKAKVAMSTATLKGSRQMSPGLVKVAARILP